MRQCKVSVMYLDVLWLFVHFYAFWCIASVQGVDHEPVLAICPGTCVALESECNTTLDGTHCGPDAKCCLDSMEGVTEIGFDFTTLPSSEWKDSMNEGGIVSDTSNLQLEEFADPSVNIGDFYLDSAPRFSAIDSLVSCPGACIPKKHVGLCQFIITIKDLCSPDKSCCATKEAAKKIQRDYQLSDSMIKQNFNSLNQCPGKCVHPSLTVFCDKILSSYYCPGESKCCNKQLAAADAEQIQCTGHCLPKQSTYFCHPPLKLVPDTINCKESTVCCMEVEEVEASSQSSVSEETELSELAADANGQLYYADEDGEYKALSIITSEESLSSDFAYVTDVDTESGLVSVYRDTSGNLYQMSNTEEQEIQPEVTVTESPEFNEMSEESTVSMPDDSDDMEENMQDVALVEEGEKIFSRDPIPPGERTMIRPQCPGTCISSFLKFTCSRSSAPYDGFSCPGKLVCCANLLDIEEHEEYLKSLSPYFRAAASVSHQHPECGITSYNGSPSEKNIPVEKWCWQAAVINEQNQYVCGAAIIDNSWILTPAHCVTGALRQDQSLYIRAGVSDLTSAADNALSQTRKAQSIYVHPSHNSMSLDNDIALIKLSIPLELNRNVCVVCLPVSEALDEKLCTVTGYGFLSRAGTLSLRLHEARVPVIDDIDCIANVTDALASVFILPASSFCAGGNTESCQGDAGGSLVCDNDGVYELAGMVSWSLGCKHDYVPSIYVKISASMDWINQIISASTFLKALK